MSEQKQLVSLSSLRNTRNGILLMMIGFAVGIVPGLSAFGGFLQIFGIAFMIAGRKAIPGKHSRMVFLSLVLLLLAVAVLVPADLRFSAAVSSGSSLMSNFSFAGLVAVITPYLYSAAAAYPLYFGSFLALIYFVVGGWQRKALWGFYGLTLVILLSMLYEVMTSVMALYSSAVTYSSVGQLASALSPLTAYPSLINFVWLIPYVMAYLRVRGIMRRNASVGAPIYGGYYPPSPSSPGPAQGSGQGPSAQPLPQQPTMGAMGSEAASAAGGQPQAPPQASAQPSASGAQGPAPSASAGQPAPESQPAPAQAQSQERVLFYKSSLQFIKIDQQKGPLNPGTLVITDRGVYFLAKSRWAGVSFLLTAPLAFAAYKALTSADISNMREQLKSNGSFYAERESLKSISAKPSGWLSAGEVVLNFTRPVTPYGSTVSGYSLTLQAFGKGGGVALSQDDVRALTAISGAGRGPTAEAGQGADQGAGQGAGQSAGQKGNGTASGGASGGGARRPLLQGNREAQGIGQALSAASSSAPATGTNPLPQQDVKGSVQSPVLAPAVAQPESQQAPPPSERAPEAAEQQPALPEERLVGVIPFAAKPDFSMYSLVFTNKRIIVTHVRDISLAVGAIQAAATLALGVVGFAGGNLVSAIAAKKAWSNLKKQVKEQGLQPVIRLDQPFTGIKGVSLEYSNLKKASFKKASHLTMTSDMELELHVEHRSFRNPDRAFLLDPEWAAQVEDFLRSTPLGPKLST